MSRTAHRGAVWASVGLLLALYVFIAAFFVVYREVSGPEGWHLLAAREVAQGRILYADFASSEGPILPYVYGLLLMPFGYQLLAGRILSAILSLVGVSLTAWLAARLLTHRESSHRPPGWLAPVLTLALWASLPYTIAGLVNSAPDALAGLLLALAVLAASARGHPTLRSIVAMAAVVAATGVRLSLTPAVVILLLYLVATARPRRRILLAALAGAVLGFALIWGPFLLADLPATAFNTLGFYLTVRRSIDWLRPAWDILAGAIAALPTITLLLAVLAGAGLLAFRRAPDRRVWLRREALPLTMGATALTVSLAGAPNQNVAVPLACALGSYGLLRLWSAIRSVRGQQAAVALVTMLLGLGFVFQFTMCFDRLVLRPVGSPTRADYRLNVSLARIAQAAAYADQHSAPGAPWLTFSANLVVDAGRDVLPGFEAGPLSYLRTDDTAICRRFGVVNDDILVEYLRSQSAGLVAFSDQDLARLGEARDPILATMRASYYPLRDFDRYGQAYGTLHLYVPRGQTSPVGGPFVPLEVRLGDQIAFLGYDLATETGSPAPPDAPLVVSPGDVLHLTLYWRCLKPLDQDLSVFNHLVPTGGWPGLHGQEDGNPGHGWAPTSSWTEGEVIMDDWAISVWADASAGEDTLEVGLYDPQTGVRLPIFGPDDTPWGDRLLLGRIHIVR